MGSGIYAEDVIKIEGSKSIINRVLIITSILQKPIKIYNYSSCEDVKTMQSSLTAMGFGFSINNDFVEISPPNSFNKNLQFYIQDSATAFRFLLARMAAWPGVRSTITLSPQLQNRPHKILVEMLIKLGADIKQIKDRYEINGSRLTGGLVDIDASISSQYISALILIAPLLTKDLSLKLSGSNASISYIKMTISVMMQFGIYVTYKNNIISVPASKMYNAVESYNVEPDCSSLCYFWALGALSAKYISTNYIVDSLQPDSNFINLLKLIGAEIKIENSIVCIKKNKLSGISVDMKNMPDQVPTLAVLAIFADSPITMSNISHLRHKESDRLKAIKDEFTKLGVEVELAGNSIQIIPAKKINRDAVLETYNDHRLVMAFSILKRIIPSISIKSTASVKKSNPQFFKLLNLIS